MRFMVLATDYDDTLATDGTVGAPTVAALERWRASGRRLVLVTGRPFADLVRIFPRFELFDRIVAENGATLWRPGESEVPLAGGPDERLVARLRAGGVPFSAGRCVVATRVPHEVEVLEAIRALGLELRVVFNKGAVMVLPPGVDKESGLRVALAEMGLSLRSAVGVGDAENDQAFLTACECGVAVANALPAVRSAADLATRGARGQGVEEIVEQVIVDDLASVPLSRRAVAIGIRRDGTALEVSPASALLVTGASSEGRTTVATALLDQLLGRGYQVCLVDPDADHEGFPGLVALGNARRPPAVDEVAALLQESTGASAAVNLLALPVSERQAFLGALLGRTRELRLRTGRPHFLVVNEAHQVLPATSSSGPSSPLRAAPFLLVTGHPDRLSREMLRQVEWAISVGDRPEEPLQLLAASARREIPPVPAAANGESLVWSVRDARVDAAWLAHARGAIAPGRTD